MNFLTRLGPGSSLGRAEFQVESDLGELPLLDPRRAAMQRLPWLTAAATATVLLLTAPESLQSAGAASSAAPPPPPPQQLVSMPLLP